MKLCIESKGELELGGWHAGGRKGNFVISLKKGPGKRMQTDTQNTVNEHPVVQSPMRGVRHNQGFIGGHKPPLPP